MQKILLACRPCEGKLIIVAINQTQTEEKLSDFGEFVQVVEKCSCGVSWAGGMLAEVGCMGSAWNGGGPLLHKAITVALTCRMIRNSQFPREGGFSS